MINLLKELSVEELKKTYDFIKSIIKKRKN